MLKTSLLSNTEAMQVARQNFYFEAIVKKKTTLIIGCGRKIEEGFTSSTIPNGLPCSMNRDHKNDLLIDIDPRAQPDVSMDFGHWEHIRLDLIAPKHFKRIEFEYLSIHPMHFTETQISIWLRGADRLLADNGEIAFINAHPGYLGIVNTFFSKLSHYEIKSDGTRCEKFIDVEGNVLRDRQGNEQDHKYCLVRKKRLWF